MQFTTLLSLLAVTGLSAAQQQYNITPDSVDKSLRESWCQSQQSSCPLICTQVPGVKSDQTQQNKCDANQLTYECVCDNGVRPNVTQYSQTLPFFICQAWGTQCVKKCGRDNTCSDKCLADNPCGAQAPFKPNNTASTTLATAAATGARASGSASGGTFEGNSQGKGAASTMADLGQGFGLAVLVSGLFGGMALIL